MDASVLKKILTSPPLAHMDIPHLMIFIENEPVNARAYVNLIGKKLNLPVEIYDSADNALYDMDGGLFSDRIYYILNDENVLKKSQYISFLNTKDNFVIIGFDGIKVSDTFVKDNAQFLYTFDRGDTNTLLSYIKRKYPSINATNADLTRLVEYSDHRLSTINNELDKITLLSANEQKLYFSTNQVPDIRTIDNMSVMLMILNRNIEFVKHIQLLISNSVQSMLAIYTMARKRFASSNDNYYAKLMILCYKTHSSIIDGTMSGENAVKKFVADLMG